MLVRLITTGEMEKEALWQCLKRLFPSHDFEALSFRKTSPFPGFTSKRLRPTSEGVPDDLRKIVQRLILYMDPKSGANPDRIFVLDDIELCNADQMPLVIAHVRAAVETYLNELTTREYHPRQPSDVNAMRDSLRDRCSFHFAAPMIESWLFADPRGPTNAGAPADAVVYFNRAGGAPHRDPEDFETDDEAYHATRATEGEFVWSEEHWRRHPKHYLRYLCRDAGGYAETGGGAEALRRLDWPAVLQNDAWMPYARALIADLADALGEQPPALLATGQEARLTTFRGKLPSTRWLRNL